MSRIPAAGHICMLGTYYSPFFGQRKFDVPIIVEIILKEFVYS
jgi:hypothetical protein